MLDEHPSTDSLIQRLAADLGGMGEFEAVQAQLLQAMLSILDTELASLILLDETPGESAMRKTLQPGGSWQHQVNLNLQGGIVQQCLEEGQSLWVNDLPGSAHFNPEFDAPAYAQVRSVLCIPLIVNGSVLGVLQLFNKRKGGFSLADADLAALLAGSLAQSIFSARLVRQLKAANADLEASRWELLRSRNTVRTLFNNIPAVMYIIDRSFNLISLNAAAAQRAGQPEHCLVGQHCYEVFYGRSTPCPGCQVHETLLAGRTRLRSELRGPRADDMAEWEINAYPILDEANHVEQAILVEQNVTEKRRMEGILAQSEKMAALGQLVAGVAHEISNPLTAIIANAQMLQRDLPQDSDWQESVELIALAGERATQMVRSLLDFARKDQYHLDLTDINESIRRSLAMVQHELLARTIALSFNPAPDLPLVLASADHLLGVWLNLLLNAMDSLEGQAGQVRVSTRQVDNEVWVTVADSGKGIPPDKINRIFEPFYTTKPAGRGTGLGLSVCHRIVRQHGGTITVESQVGAGTEFTIVLPIKGD